MSTQRLRALAADPRTWAFALVMVLLLISIPAYRLIPGWGKPWGLDLRNVYVFHACSGRDDPYLVTGRQCSDPLGRAMPYPPLMYWALVWMRWVSLPAARWIWAAFIALVLIGGAVIWSRPEPREQARGRWSALLFGVLLVSQFPAVFAIERGNNDTFVVLLWTGAIALFVRDRRFLAGCAAGLAAAAKLYPAVSCAVLIAGAAGTAFRGRHDRDRRNAALLLAAGLAAAPAAVTLVFWTQTRHYLDRVLPAFAAHLPAESLHSHSVPATAGAAAGVVSAVMVAAWCVAALLRLERAPVEIFAGALAVSTYVAGTSFDYNLVTVYPLLIVLFARPLPCHEQGRRASARVVPRARAGPRVRHRPPGLVRQQGNLARGAPDRLAPRRRGPGGGAAAARARAPESALQPAAEAR